MYQWVTSDKFKGVRWHQHPTRRHGVQYDRLYGIRYQLGGTRYENIFGWASEGWTESRAALELAKLKQAYKTGDGDYTLAEKQRKAEATRRAQAEAHKREQRQQICLDSFWSKHYWPAQQYKAKGSLVAESSLYARWIHPALGGAPLATLSALDMEKLKAAMLEAGKSPASVKYAFAVVSQVWNQAKRDGLLSGDCPARAVALPKRDNRRQRFLTPEEAHKLLRALTRRSPQTHDMALLALQCGLRFGEIAALDWQCVDWHSGVLAIRDPKARTNRMAFMTKDVRTMLERRQEEEQKADKTAGRIFQGRQGQKLVAVSDTFTRIADEMFNQGITDPRQKVCFHSLRHTFASWLVQRGVDIYSVRELMGHADLKMTTRYSHLSPDGLRKAVEAVESVALD